MYYQMVIYNVKDCGCYVIYCEKHVAWSNDSDSDFVDSSWLD